MNVFGIDYIDDNDLYNILNIEPPDVSDVLKVLRKGWSPDGPTVKRALKIELGRNMGMGKVLKALKFLAIKGIIPYKLSANNNHRILDNEKSMYGFDKRDEIIANRDRVIVDVIAERDEAYKMIEDMKAMNIRAIDLIKRGKVG